MAAEHRRDYICGFLSAAVTTISTYPINKLTYRQILEHSKLQSAYSNVKKDGVFILYRGVFPPIVQKMISLSTMFGVFNSASRSLMGFGLNPRLQTFMAGLASGTMEATTMPFERVQVLLVNSKYHLRYRNTLDTFVKIGIQYGFKEYYRGFRLIWIRCTLSNTSFFVAKGEAQRILGTGESVWSEGLKNFFTGGVIGGFLAMIFYPFKVMKVVYHEKVGGRVPSISEVFSTVYYGNGTGVQNFFRGVLLNGARSLLSWGITNMTFEFFKKLL